MLSDRFQPSYLPLSLAQPFPWPKKSTSLRFTNCAKSMAIRSRSCRACESASICLWPKRGNGCCAVEKLRRRRTSNTSTPTLTRSSARVNPLRSSAVVAGVPPACRMHCSRHGCLYTWALVINHRFSSYRTRQTFLTEPHGVVCRRINWRRPSNLNIGITQSGRTRRKRYPLRDIANSRLTMS